VGIHLLYAEEEKNKADHYSSHLLSCIVNALNKYHLESFFLTNAVDKFCNSYVYHLVGLHIGQLRSDINTTSSLKNDKTI
jgi:hypothetical protein